MRLRVSPYSASCSWLGGKSFELPRCFCPSTVPALDIQVASNIAFLQRCWFMRSAESPRLFTPPCNACNEGLRFPFVPHLRLYRRWISELPQSSHPSAVPTGRFSSCPEFQSFGIADDSCSGLPRTANPPVPSDGSPSHLGLRTFRLLPVANFQVALNLLSSGPPFNQFPGCPKSWVSRRRRLIDLRVTPNFSPSADPSLLPQVAPILHRRLDR